jgi:hypothetical protein
MGLVEDWGRLEALDGEIDAKGELPKELRDRGDGLAPWNPARSKRRPTPV